MTVNVIDTKGLYRFDSGWPEVGRLVESLVVAGTSCDKITAINKYRISNLSWDRAWPSAKQSLTSETEERVTGRVAATPCVLTKTANSLEVTVALLH